MEEGAQFVQAKNFFGRIALKFLRPAFQELSQDGKGERPAVSLQILCEAENERLVIELDDGELVPPFVHVVVFVEGEKKGHK
jgi:hypothetical protein